MAIIVQCNHCQNILELDDGFRGGVCRCSQCGALLQVPKGQASEGPQGRPATPGGAKRPERPPMDTGLSRGQFDPRSGSQAGRPAVGEASGSGAFARSPLQTTSVASPTTTRSGPPTTRQQIVSIRKTNALLYAGVTLLIVVVVTVIVVLVMAVLNNVNEKPIPTTAGGGTAVRGTERGTGGGSTVAAGPQFMGIPLVGKRIVISIDAGSSAQDSFDYLRKGTGLAIDSLAADQEIVVVLWKEEGLVKFPASGWARRGDVEAIRGQLENAAAFGASEALDCMRKSLELGGDQVVFVTAKYGLAKELAEEALTARKAGQRIDGIKVSTIVATGDPESPLEIMASKANGMFLRLDSSRLDALVNPRRD